MTRAIVGLIVTVLSWQQGAPTFRSGVDVVTVDVSVRDRSRVITGLTAADFEVLDNGVRQEIVDVTYGKLPIDVTVALDVSFSVTGDTLERLRRATVQLMKDLGRDDRLRLITFNARVSRVVDFTDDIPSVERAIRSASAGGGTSIFDTLSTALVSSNRPDRRQLLVLFTDGADSTSITEPRVLFDVVQRTNVAVTTVMPAAPLELGNAGVSNMGITVFRAETPATDRSRIYTRLATETGGQVIPLVRASDDLTSTFRKALDDFRSSYVLHFTPKGVERTGFHALQVTVPKRDSLTVRARRGYSID